MAQEAVGRPPEETLSLWKREQALLKARVVDQDTEAWQRDPAFAGLQRVGGVDVSFVKGDSVRACASLVVLSYPELEVLYEDSRLVHLTAPYLSGFLAFREVPFLVDAVQRLQEKEPSLMPQIRLLRAGGDSFPLRGGSGAVLGRALRSHDRSTKPLYVSVGHKMSLEAAVRLTHSCCRFRVPEPVRQADIRSRDYIRRTLGGPRPPAPGQERKAPRPKVWPQGGPEEPPGEGKTPEAHSPGLRTHPEAPDLGAQGQ
ncbi:endonuclease V isoform X4 [Myotis daubentonii]|uniref:endonuclease V isoform X4 n=1 Tax=Myotis daubentonii TaxID=98922 RepID=UPI0028732981|nr:endonuclease V isoform X4 [Myotis daubentonii]